MLTNWVGSADGPAWIETDWPNSVVRGLFTFRTGGISGAPYDSLNVGFHVSDNAEHVRENRQICAERIGGTLEEWVVPEQVHGNKVAVVEKWHSGLGSVVEMAPIAESDALITNVPSITLTVLSADCVPILFFDPKHHAIGAAHSGWKGTVGHIAREVVTAMSGAYGTNAEDLQIWLGPSIRRCCYEVDATVASPIREQFGASHLTRRQGAKGKFLLSLQSCIRQDLVNAGVPNHQIRDVGVCTSCRTDVLFSHRAEKGKTGRFMGAVRLVGTS